MRLWKAALLMNLALLCGVGWGYLFWGVRADRLARELEAGRASPATLGAERVYEVTGVVRATLPDLDGVVVTHDEIPGYMPAMTMGFRAAAPEILRSVQAGDAVRFTLRGTLPSLAITALEKIAPRAGAAEDGRP